MIEELFVDQFRERDQAEGLDLRARRGQPSIRRRCSRISSGSCSKARDTVFFTAFSDQRSTRTVLGNLVADMVSLAPQLTHGFVGARPGQPFPKHMLDAITDRSRMVDEFDGYPDKWLSQVRRHLRAQRPAAVPRQVAVRRGGPDAEGRASIIQVRSSHALLEGSDSAMLTRSQSAAHGVMATRRNKVSLVRAVHGQLRGP